MGKEKAVLQFDSDAQVLSQHFRAKDRRGSDFRQHCKKQGGRNKPKYSSGVLQTQRQSQGASGVGAEEAAANEDRRARGQHAMGFCK